MFSKLLLATALSLSLGGAALAQSDEGATTPQATDQAGEIGSNTTMPEGWDGEIGDAFFADDNMTLRSDDEIAANWGDLTAEQQAQVRLDCENMSTAMNDTGAEVDETQTSATETTTGTSAGGGTGGAADSESNQSMTQLCDWVATQ
ncbi:MAG: hypothetical protein K5872_22835 [Rhizobiaceae bacterium]|nr:hypothetical protein [Rhizobiaceae bacterium]MCV0409059.1 hypothetical protein [Rhizobiaceae bacterium]